jgi:4-hydroxy-tetrahydrodipicolinate synthase
MQKVIGLKDATGDVSRVSRLRALVGREFRLLSGDDATAFAFIANGGDGCISVTSNVAPGLCRDLYLALRSGNLHRAQRLAGPLADLTAALFLEPNPAPVKYALSLIGMMSPKVRLPLVEAGLEAKNRIAAQMQYVRERYDGSMPPLDDTGPTVEPGLCPGESRRGPSDRIDAARSSIAALGRGS